MNDGELAKGVADGIRRDRKRLGLVRLVAFGGFAIVVTTLIADATGGNSATATTVAGVLWLIATGLITWWYLRR